MRPVKVEIIADDKTGKGIGDAKKNVAELTAEYKRQLREARGEVTRTGKQLSELEQVLSKSSGSNRQKAAPVLEELKASYKSAKQALEELEQEYKEFQTGNKTLRQEIRELEMAMVDLTEGTDEYRAAMQRLGDLYDTRDDIKKQGRVIGDDEKNIRATADAIAGLSGAMSAGVGIASLFGASQEKLAQIQTRLQAVMAVTIGLQQVAETLNKDSFFSLVILGNIKEWWRGITQRATVAQTAETAAVTADTAAKTGNTAATGTQVVAAKASTLANTKLAGAFRLVGAAIKSIPGIGWLLAGISALTVVYARWSKKQREINKLKKEYNDIDRETAISMAGEKTRILTLMRAADNLNNTLDVRNKAIKEIKKQMPEYNGYINNEGILIGNADSALKSYLDTLYKVERAKKLFAKIEEKQGEIDAADKAEPEKAGFWQKAGAFFAQNSYATYDAIVNDINDQYKQKKNEGIQVLKDELKVFEDELDELANDESVFKSIFGNTQDYDEGTIGAIEEAISKKRDAIKHMSDPAEIKKTNAEIKALEAQLEGLLGTASPIDIPENRLDEMRLNALKKIKEQEIALMQEGEEKRKAQAAFELENRLQEIANEKAAREKHLAELKEAGIPLMGNEEDTINEQAKTQAIQAAEKYAAEITNIENESANHFASIQSELQDNFKTRLEQQLSDADNYYDRLLEKAGDNAALITQIEEARARTRKEINHESELRELEIANDLELKRAQLADKSVWLAADREKELLDIELKGAKKRLDKLEQMQKDGMDTAEDIEQVRLEVERLEKSLEKLPIKRVREIGTHLSGWMNSLAGIGGDFGEAMSGLAGGVDSIVKSLDVDLDTTEGKLDMVGIAVENIVKLYQLAANQIRANKEAQAAWNAKMEEAAHNARMMRIAALDYKEGNIFGVENPYTKAIAGAEQYGAAMKELNTTLGALSGGQVQTDTKKVVSGENIAKGAGAGAGLGAAIGSFIPGIGTLIGAGIGALIGGVFGSTQAKVVPVFESLTQKFGSILKEGTETFELNPAILENYNKLDDETKKLIDNWEELREKALEAQEQMRQTFKDLAGDIGDTLSDALVDAFKSGDIYSAMDKFSEKVDAMIEDITAQLIFSQYFGKLFDQLGERFEGSFDVGGDQDIRDDIIWFAEEYKKQMSGYADAIQTAKEEFEKQGLNVFGSDSERGGAAKGISGLTQDQGNKLEGQLTSVQGRLMTIDKNVVGMVEILYRIFDPINRIADNTDRLEAIENSMYKMNEGVDRMVREGVFIKK